MFIWPLIVVFPRCFTRPYRGRSRHRATPPAGETGASPGPPGRRRRRSRSGNRLVGDLRSHRARIPTPCAAGTGRAHRSRPRGGDGNRRSNDHSRDAGALGPSSNRPRSNRPPSAHTLLLRGGGVCAPNPATRRPDAPAALLGPPSGSADQRVERGMPNPTMAMMSRWISLVPPPKVKMLWLRVLRSRPPWNTAPADPATR